MGVELYYIANFLDKKEADQYLKIMIEKFPFHQEQSTVFGNTYDQPRLTRLGR